MLAWAGLTRPRATMFGNSRGYEVGNSYTLSMTNGGMHITTDLSTLIGYFTLQSQSEMALSLSPQNEC